MTTYLPVTFSPRAAPTFQPTFDGSSYLCSVVWNLFGRRYYVNCFDNMNNRVFTVALIESPPAALLSTLSWDAASLTVTATTAVPHGLRAGSTVQLTVAGATPDGYNGEFDCWVTGASTFCYNMASDPGTVVVPGSASQLLSMTAGYFSSTLVWRNGQFEVSP